MEEPGELDSLDLPSIQAQIVLELQGIQKTLVELYVEYFALNIIYLSNTRTHTTYVHSLFPHHFAPAMHIGSNREAAKVITLTSSEGQLAKNQEKVGFVLN